MLSMKKLYKLILQVGILTAVSAVGNALTAHFHWPVPGNIVGMLLMLILLQTKVVRLDWVEAGASWLLAEMLLFFIPAAVGVIQYKQLMVTSGGRILLVIVVSTLAVMGCTGFLVERLSRLRAKGGDDVGRA